MQLHDPIASMIIPNSSCYTLIYHNIWPKQNKQCGKGAPMLQSGMWKRKLEAEAVEAVIF